MSERFFEEGVFYHVYNRGTEGRDIFGDDSDYLRFIHYLYVLNDANQQSNIPLSDSSFDGEGNKKSRDVLVDICAYVLMPNHYHLLLYERRKGGISKFMHKLSTGQTMYFNSKYDRNGVLFQGRFKAKPIFDESYLAYLTYYIHANPLVLFVKTENKSSLQQLEDYRWSSYLDYIGKNNFSSVVNTKPLRPFVDFVAEYKIFFENIALERGKTFFLPEGLSIDATKIIKIRPHFKNSGVEPRD
ncbi:MAG: transposase [Candidatus Vogelbacteria bacterium]|nr:transposase [Candidatus Vogelbacteria bacterium]